MAKFGSKEYHDNQSAAMTRRWAQPGAREKQSEDVKRVRGTKESRDKTSKQATRQWADPTHREKVIPKLIETANDPVIKANRTKSIIEAWKDPTLLENQSIAAIKQWEDPDYRNRVITKLKETINTPEHLELMSTIGKDLVADPDYLKKVSDGVKKAYAEDPEYIKKVSAASKENWENPEYRKNKIDQLIEMWQDPARHKAMSEIMKQDWAQNYERRAAALPRGEDHPAWNGGISPADYAIDFKRSASKINTINKFNGECQFILDDGTICGKTKKDNGCRALSRHHIFPHTKDPYKPENMTQEKMDLVRKNLPATVARFWEPEYSEEERKYIDMHITLCIGHHHVKEVRREEQNNIPYEETTCRKRFVEIILLKEMLESIPSSAQ